MTFLNRHFPRLHSFWYTYEISDAYRRQIDNVIKAERLKKSTVTLFGRTQLTYYMFMMFIGMFFPFVIVFFVLFLLPLLLLSLLLLLWLWLWL